MGATTYTGTITTTGMSEAIRLEKALFKAHPEFRQKAKVQAHVIGPGTMLVAVADNVQPAEDVDPVMAAFLSFLTRDIAENPARVVELGSRIEKARQLTRGAIDAKTGKLTHLGNAALPDSMAYVATDRSGRYLLSGPMAGTRWR
jgi:antitoxin PrlF